MPPKLPEPPARLVLIEPPPRRRHPVIWLLAAIVLLFAAAVWRSGASREGATAARIRTARATTGRVEQTLRVSGAIAAERRGSIVAPYLIGNRRISEATSFALTLRKLAPAGSRVKKGEVVAEFDRESMLNRHEEYLSWVMQQRINLIQLGVQLENKRRAYQQSLVAAKAKMEKAALDLKTIPVRSAIRAERLRLDYEEARAAYNEKVNRME